jgi:hypothetical protein
VNFIGGGLFRSKTHNQREFLCCFLDVDDEINVLVFWWMQFYNAANVLHKVLY